MWEIDREAVDGVLRMGRAEGVMGVAEMQVLFASRKALALNILFTMTSHTGQLTNSYS